MAENDKMNRILHDFTRIAAALDKLCKDDVILIQAIMDSRENKAILRTQLDRLYEDLEKNNESNSGQRRS